MKKKDEIIAIEKEIKGLRKRLDELKNVDKSSLSNKMEKLIESKEMKALKKAYSRLFNTGTLEIVQLVEVAWTFDGRYGHANGGLSVFDIVNEPEESDEFEELRIELEKEEKKFKNEVSKLFKAYDIPDTRDSFSLLINYIC